MFGRDLLAPGCTIILGTFTNILFQTIAEPLVRVLFVTSQVYNAEFRTARLRMVLVSTTARHLSAADSKNTFNGFGAAATGRRSSNGKPSRLAGDAR